MRRGSSDDPNPCPLGVIISYIGVYSVNNRGLDILPGGDDVPSTAELRRAESPQRCLAASRTTPSQSIT